MHIYHSRECRARFRPRQPRLSLAATAVAPLVLLLALLACTPRDDGAAADQPRVVSVSKQINEFLYAIGAEEVIVGRDLTSVYPPAIRNKTSVGYHRALSAEGITSLRPTMLLTDGNVGPDVVLQRVQDVGIPVLVLRPGAGVDSAQMLMARLGREFNHEHEADSVIAVWRAGMAQVEVDSARWANEPHPRVLMMHFGQIVNDYLAIRSGGTADRILRWAGGVNAVDSLGGMMRLNPEAIARLAPDIIIATDVGFDRLGSVDRFAELPGVALTPAGRDHRIYRVDETEIMYFGPRTPAAVEHLAHLIHDGTPTS